MTTKRMERLLTEGLARIGQAAFPDRDTAGPLVEGEPLHGSPGTLTVPTYEDNPNRRPVRGGSPVLIAACMFVAVAVVGALALDRGSPERDPLVTDRAQTTEDQVLPLPEARFSARWHHVSARVGDEVIIWGGEDVAVQSSRSSTADLGVQHEDGAAYNLRTETWRTIAPSPLSARERARSAVFDGEVYVFGGVRDGVGYLRDGAAYDPDTDGWRLIPDVPVCPSAIAPTASGILVIGQCEEGAPVGAAVYDAVENRWLEVAAPPVRGLGLVVENAGHLLVEDGVSHRIFTYDAIGGSWSDIGTPPISWNQWIQGQLAVAATDDGSVVVIATVQFPEANSDSTQLVSWRPAHGWDEARVIDAPSPDMLPPQPLLVMDSRIAWMGQGDAAWYDLDDGSVGTIDLRAHGVGLTGSPQTLLPAAPHGDLVVWGGSHSEAGNDAHTGALILLS